jgi:hypothetical protein
MMAFGLRIVLQVGDVLGEADADRVPKADDLAEARSSDPGIVGQGIDHVPALGQYGNRTLLKAGNAKKVHVRRGAEHAAAVGADHVSPCLRRLLQDLRFDLFPLFSALAKTRCNDDDPLGAHCDAVRNRRLQEPRRNHDHDQVHLFFHGPYARVGFSAEEFGPLGVDQVDLALILPFDQAPGSSFRRLPRNLGSPDHGNGPGVEYPVKGPAHLWFSFSPFNILGFPIPHHGPTHRGVLP